ncbi:DUF1616 domain-containing protein [Methanogenium sp. S4BF]|uniref:DUF1616 domain-containing protein n=1 Tax=Methanogenium sp. S4BF TaxID=1789226 RepID=UPI002417AD73|nr:DUF1616 domain-containing protein [Methanogenium sp. S4BF]WFN35117.1 DUF1616 domain-containing protein [Methanogenium sp. S4BF]
MLLGGSIIEFIAILLAFFRAIFGFFLILFIPGYTLTLVLYPGKTEISVIERTGLSIVMSMGSVLLIVLFIDEVLAFNTTPVNIVCAVLIFSFLALCVWKTELILKKNFMQNVFPLRPSAVIIRSKSGDTDSREKESEEEGNNDDF